MPKQVGERDGQSEGGAEAEAEDDKFREWCALAVVIRQHTGEGIRDEIYHEIRTKLPIHIFNLGMIATPGRIEDKDQDAKQRPTQWNGVHKMKPPRPRWGEEGEEEEEEREGGRAKIKDQMWLFEKKNGRERERKRMWLGNDACGVKTNTVGR